jgi:hypothetical protein
MRFYVIHEPRFPLRKVFLQAQFKRYDIVDYEFIEIPSSGAILSTYIQMLRTIKRYKNDNNTSDNLYCILIDTILLTRRLLDCIEYSHFMEITSERSQNIMFIHPNSNHSTKIKVEIKTLHKDTWKWDDQINQSSCFVVTPLSAKLLYEYHKHCKNTNEYDDINKIYLYKNKNITGALEQSLVSLDGWLYECIVKYSNSNYPLQSSWIS